MPSSVVYRSDSGRSWGMGVTTDYYAVLGVSRDASAEEIKMAYHRLARELHPDVNPDPVSQERFKEVTEAHRVLSDPDKRQMHDLGGDPFPAANSYSSQARRQGAQDGYRPDGESDRQRWAPRPSDGAWQRSWGQAPYSDYLGGRSASLSYDGRLPPAVMPHRSRLIPAAIVLIAVGLTLAVVVAARGVIHRANSLDATAVTAMKTISVIHATWAPPPPGATQSMTAMQAWLTWSHGISIRPTAQFGLFTQPFGPAGCGPACDGLPVRHGLAYRALNQLAYGYFWRACVPPANAPYIKCWSWLFLDANTGAVIAAGASNRPLVSLRG
jgi:hypothetical protein